MSNEPKPKKKTGLDLMGYAPPDTMTLEEYKRQREKSDEVVFVRFQEVTVNFS